MSAAAFAEEGDIESARRILEDAREEKPRGSGS
jgi:hypothetical protein